MLDGTFIDQMVAHTQKPLALKVNGVEHLLTPGSEGFKLDETLLAPEHEPAALALNTLTGFVDYLAGIPENRDGLETHTCRVHIVDPQTVELRSDLVGEFVQRFTYARAKAQASSFSFGQFTDLEWFNVALQSLFVDDPARRDVLLVVGNVKEESVSQSSDDGTTQTVLARAGVVAVKETPVPNPVLLKPYRTFREIDQPASPFVLRMKPGGQGGLPTCALFEADGGAWRLEAIQKIADWLKSRVPDGLSVIA